MRVRAVLDRFNILSGAALVVAGFLDHNALVIVCGAFAFVGGFVCLRWLS